MEKVYDVQKELDEVHNKAAEEIVQVEIKFNKLRTPMSKYSRVVHDNIPNMCKLRNRIPFLEHYLIRFVDCSFETLLI